jgi:hypothetical protein
MNLFLENKDILLKILSYTEDPQDWMCFMMTCTQIHLLYSSFLCTKFRIMMMYFMEIPICVYGNKRIKFYYERRNSTILVTDPYMIFASSQICTSEIFEIHGYTMISVTSFNKGIKYDHEKLLNIITKYCDNNSTLTDTNFYIIATKLFFPLDTFEYHRIAVEFCHKYRNQYLETNLGYINKIGPFRSTGPINTRYKYPDNWICKKCIFCKNYYNRDDIKNHEVIHDDGHGESRENYSSDIFY